MEHLRTYEGFFSKDSVEDNIAKGLIGRLKKVKEESPYEIEVGDGLENTEGTLKRYTIHFQDLSVKVLQLSLHRRPDQGLIDAAGLSRREAKYPLLYPHYKVNIECTGDWEPLKCKYKHKRDLFYLIDKVYKQDIEWRRINKIRTEYNPEADLLD